ncbi:hypothetical protein ASPCAL07357 [Aspergillus calidoustus]|uniref:Uncharacterized protein n=1 Tax=Aspergillus calidoustus TaxID=454130 RepID=A0A0U5CAI2_ASPCI|nr:hypothetical protein ASPCAL07357 [Aspergillus calidoustus]
MIRLSTENALRAVVGAFFLSCTFIVTSYSTTFAFDQPFHTAVLACFLSGVSILILSRFADRISNVSLPTDKYSAVPLSELDTTFGALPANGLDNHGPSTHDRLSLRWWLKVGVLSGIACARIALFRSSTENIECAPTGYTYLVPFLVAVYDSWRNQRAAICWARPSGPQNALVHAFISLASRVRYLTLQSRLRYVISATFLVFSGIILASFKGDQSTYICPIVSGEHTRQQTFGYLSLLLDFLIITGSAELSSEGGRPGDGNRKQGLISWGYGLLGVALFWIPWVVYLTVKNGGGTFATSNYLRSAWGQAALVAIAITSASQMLPQYGMVGLCVLGGFIASYFNLLSTIVNGQEPFPLIHPSHAFAALFFCSIGGLIFLFSRTASDDEPQFLTRLNWVLRFVIVTLFGIGLFWIFSQPSISHLHPIELLIHEAGENHDTWLRTAKESIGLAEAVQHYQVKYGQHPPPYVFWSSFMGFVLIALEILTNGMTTP